MFFTDKEINPNGFTKANSGSTSPVDIKVNVSNNPRTINTKSGKANFNINKIKIKKN